MVDVTKVELTAQDGATAALNAHRSVVDRLDEAYQKFERDLQRYNTTATSSASVHAKLNDVSTNAVRNIAQSVAAYASVTTAVNTFLASIDRMDQIDDMSKKLALNTQTLQENAYAGKLSGVALGSLADGQKKLQLSMVAAATGGKEEAAVFKAMGIAVQDASGQMRSSEDVMRELADVVSSLEDGALKTTLASKLLGKSAGPEMVAYLNEGSEGIRRMAEEAHALGGVMDKDAIRAAAEFNDQVDRLKTVTQGAANEITSAIVPAINDLIERFIQGKKAGMDFWEAAGNAANVTMARAMGQTYGEQIRNINREIENLQTSKNPFSLFGGKSLDEDVEKLGKVKKVLQEMQAMRALEGDPAENEDWFDRRYGAKHRSNASAIQTALNTQRDTKYDSAIQKSEDFIAQIKKEAAEVGATTEQKKKYEVEQIASQMKLAGVRSDVISRFKREAYQEIEIYDARQKKFKEEEEHKKFLLKATEELNKAGSEAIRQLDADILKQQEHNDQIGKSKSQVEAIASAKLKLAAATDEEMASNLRSAAIYAGDLHDAYIQHANDLELAAKRKRELANLKGEASSAEATAEAAKKAGEEWKRTSDEIERSLNDALIRGFEGGEDALHNFIRSVKNQLLTSAFKIPVQYVAGTISSIFNPGAPQAGQYSGISGLSQGANLVNAGSTAWNAFSGGMGGAIGTGISGFGSLVGSSTISGFGAGFGAAAGGADAAMLSYASNIGNLSAGASAGASVGSAFATAVPYLAAAYAIYSIVKSMDDSGTMHTGGAGEAGAGNAPRAIDARWLGFVNIDTTRQAQDAAVGIASSIVGMLDSTAETFGREAGYGAATAFADDTSDDGAWGGLRITRGGGTVLDWDDTRQSNWAPREYADGEAGRDQYLADISSSVRSALDGIGLPGWAQGMIDRLGDSPTIQELGSVVEQINAAQRALSSMGDVLAGIGGLSDGAVSALIEASGGVDALASGATAYYEGYFSDAEKIANVTRQVSEALSAVGLEMPATREEFRALVEAQMDLDEAGAPAVATLFRVASAFGMVADAAQQTAQDTAARTSRRSALEIQIMQLTGNAAGALAAQRAIELSGIEESLRPLQERIYALQDEAAAARRRGALEIQIMQLTGNAAGALAAQRAIELSGIEESLRPLQERIFALQDEAIATQQRDAAVSKGMEDIDNARDVLADAYSRESDALRDAIEQHEEYANSLRSAYDSLLVGSLSTLSPQGMYEELRQRAERTYSLALSGDTSAQAELPDVIQQFLESSQRINASNTVYGADFNWARTMLDSASTSASRQADIGRSQLAALDRSVQGLIDINQNVISVRDAITALNSTISAASASTGGQITATGYNSANVGTRGWDADGDATFGENDVAALMARLRMIDGSHASGLRRVPRNGYVAELHEDEAVLTAQEARKWRSNSQGGENPHLAVEIRNQTAAIDRQNQLIGKLVGAIEVGGQISGEQMRDLKQHLAHVIARKVPA